MQLVRNLYLGGDEKTFRARSRRPWSRSTSRTPLEAVDPHRLPQHRPLRHRRRPDRRGRAGGRANVLRPPGLSRTRSRSPRCSRACRRRRRTTTRSSTPPAARDRRNEVLATMAVRLHLRRARRRRRARAAGGQARTTTTRSFHEAVLLRLRARAAGARATAETVAAGDLKVYTTIDPHLSAQAAQGDQDSPEPARRPRRRRSSRENPANGYVDTIAQSGQLRAVAVQPRRRGPAPARVDVQGDRARRRALARDRPVHAPTTSRTRSSPAGCRGYPTYKVTIDGGGNLDAARSTSTRRRSRPTTPSSPSSPPTSARRASRRWPTRWAWCRAPAQLSGRGARRPDASASRHSRWRTSTRRSPTAAGATSRSRSRRSCSRTATSTRAGARPTASRCSRPATADVETEILQHNVEYGTATRSAIGCPTAAKTGTTAASSSTRGSTASRRSARRSCGWATRQANISMTDVHGRAAARRAAAGGDLARLHGAGRRGRRARRFPTRPPTR